MKIERKVVFTEEETKAVAKVVKLLEELVDGNDIYNVYVEYNPTKNIALNELLKLINEFQKFVNYSCEWQIKD